MCWDDPIFDHESYNAFVDKIWEYKREGPQGCKIIQTYCLEFVNPEWNQNIDNAKSAALIEYTTD